MNPPEFVDTATSQLSVDQPGRPATTTPPIASRDVWAVIVPRQPGDPNHGTRPERVVWIGDPTWRIGTAQRCIYCGGAGDCAGVTAHALSYATQLSRRDASTVYALECFTVEPGVSRSGIAEWIELLLAQRRADAVYPARR